MDTQTQTTQGAEKKFDPVKIQPIFGKYGIVQQFTLLEIMGVNPLCGNKFKS